MGGEEGERVYALPLFVSLKRLHAITGSYLAAGEHVGARPSAAYQAAQHPGADESFEMRARFAASLPETLVLPDPEALPDRIVQRHAPYNEVPISSITEVLPIRHARRSGGKEPASIR